VVVVVVSVVIFYFPLEQVVLRIQSFIYCLSVRVISEVKKMNIKVSLICVVCLAATAMASNAYPPPKPQYQPKPAYPPPAYKPSYPQPSYKGEQQGYGYEEKYEEHPPKYQFQWEVKDDYTYNNYYHNEARDGYDTYGEYGVQLPDGRFQTVKYVVDKWGYKADVQYQGEAKYDQPKAYGGGGYEQPKYKPQPSYQQPSYEQPAYGQSYQPKPSYGKSYQPAPYKG
jgi:hypothetical protein